MQETGAGITVLHLGLIYNGFNASFLLATLVAAGAV